MLRKTMRVGGTRTSIKLEAAFWDHLAALAGERRMRLSTLVNEVAAANPDRTNLASTLRTFALRHANERHEALRRELDRLLLAGNSQDLTLVLEACPVPCLVLDEARTIRQLNRAFALWLNLDRRATLGQRLDSVLIVRSSGSSNGETWAALAEGRLPRASLQATYVSPGRVRAAQAVVVALGGEGEGGRGRRYVVMFEVLPARA